jgi:hypothetical protein
VIDDRFCTETNADVVSFLRQARPSAHSDVAEELTRAGAGIPGLRSHCPDSSRYAFVALYLEDLTIVALAFGMSGLAFRLPADRVSEALRAGGAIAADLGPGWVRFQPWTDRETLAQSRERLTHWCSIAAGWPGADSAP